MQPITQHDFFFQSQIQKIVSEQMKTNELLQQLLDTLKPPKEGVEQVDSIGNVGNAKRKRR